MNIFGAASAQRVAATGERVTGLATAMNADDCGASRASRRKRKFRRAILDVNLFCRRSIFGISRAGTFSTPRPSERDDLAVGHCV